MSSHAVSVLPVGSSPCRCQLTQREVKLVVVTGGPGAGKTAVLETTLAYPAIVAGVLP